MMRKTALLFAGQGAQVPGMGRDLADCFATAEEYFDRARATLGDDLPSVCFHGPEEALTRTENAQPAIFLTSWVAFQMLMERVPGLSFQATAGLSLGELTALAAAGGLGFDEGLRMARMRGRFMQEACEATCGAMAAVLGLEAPVLSEVCAAADVEMENLNCPGQIVISGEIEKIEKACELAKARNRQYRRAVRLPVAGAYHSRLMASASAKSAGDAGVGPVAPPALPVISNVTARPYADVDDIRRRLTEQVISPVRWEDHPLFGGGRFYPLYELGPGTALSGFK